ncbi:beta transducin [Elasticomyces elasticus]|nr:beta transducin [Elasticomyces elasticus]
MGKRKVSTAAATGQEPLKKKKKRESRPIKVMSTRKLSKYQQEIYKKNAADSPLLRLPPEIRNQIWCLVLGGNSMLAPWNPEDELDTALVVTRHLQKDEKTGWYDGHGAHYVGYSQRHADCPAYPYTHYGTSVPLGLAIIQSCRQTHQETALLPYQNNKFVCLDLENLACFLQTLVLEQARAVETLTVHVRWPYATATFKNLLKRKLKGVRTLTCFLEMGNDIDDDPNADVVNSKWTDSVLQFQDLGLTSVRVLPYNAFNGGSQYQGGQLREWVEELEVS